ncbi:MAG: protein kinase, partial [Vicinamibacterales bacterium]
MSVIGQTVGRYQIAGLLGRGGMGVVYKAYDSANGAAVALKSLPHADPAALYRFKQEFRSLVDISHPHLASLYELFAIEDAWWLAMEYVDGVDFLSHIRGTETLAAPPSSSSDDQETSDPSLAAAVAGRLPAAENTEATLILQPDQIERLRASLAQLAGALAALHASDTLHRDIKPSNVMVDRSGRTVLLDFGLATAISGTKAAGGDHQVLGTLSYMAPEQATSAQLTPAVDWYAIGVMMFQALAGRLPFTGSGAELIREKQERDAPALKAIDPRLPDDLCTLCEGLLQRDPARRPSGKDILARLGSTDTAERLRGDELLFGRDQQVWALRDLLLHARKGAPAAVFVQGRSGAGKSHLIRHFLAEARGIPGAVVLAGRCYEDESVPYKALDSLIDALAQFLKGLAPAERAVIAPRDAVALTKIFPVLRQVSELTGTARPEVLIPDQQEMRRRAFRGLRELLGRIGDRRPLILHVDDLQWGDADSAALLADLLRPPDPPVLLLLCAYRSEYADKSPCVQALRQAYATNREVLTRYVDVEPLAPGQAVELARALLPPGIADGDVRAAAIAQESGGIPFFIHELARHSTEELPTADPAGADLDELIRRRVATLPEAARAVLEVVSICGHPITRQALTEAAEVGVEDRAALRLLRTAHFVRTTGSGNYDWVEPYHDRIREAVAAQLPPHVTRDHHRRVAVSLEAAKIFDPETLALHFESGEIRDRAGHDAALAADAAADILAFERASSLYAKALDLQTLSEGDARTLRVRLADALANDGRGPDAASNYLAAAAGAEPDQAQDLQRLAAYQYCVSGHLEQGRATLRTLLGGINVPMPDARAMSIARLLIQRGRLRLRGLRFSPRPASLVPPRDLLRSDLTWAASAGLSMFDILQGAEFQSRNLYHALSIGEPYRIARALAWEAAHTSNAGAPSWPRTSRLLAEARAIAKSIDHPHAHGMAGLSTGIAEFTMGRWTSARERLEEAQEIFRSRCTGVAWELDTSHTFELWARIYSGDLNAMSLRTAALLKEARDRGDRYALTTLGAFMVPHARLVEDDAAGAARAVDEYLRLWGIDGYH